METYFYAADGRPQANGEWLIVHQAPHASYQSALVRAAEYTTSPGVLAKRGGLFYTVDYREEIHGPVTTNLDHLAQ